MPLRTVLDILHVEGITQAYLLKTSTSHNKYLNFQFLENNDLISAKSAAHMLSLNVAYAFLLLNSLITGLCNFLR